MMKIHQVSALLEALFASLLKDENKDLRRKKERALRSKANKIQAQGEDEEDIIRVEEGEEEEVVKVSMLFFNQGHSQQGLDWIVGPEYSFGVFSASRFAPAALRSVEFVVRIKCYKQTDAPYR